MRRGGAGGWIRDEIARAPLAYGALLVVLASFLAYANTLDAGFHFDDEHTVLANPFVRDLRYVPQYFHRPDLFSALPGHAMYRPMVLSTYALNYRWGGYDPLPGRLTAIALHSLCAVGVFLAAAAVAARLTPRPSRVRTRGALVAALLFAVHPALTETVNYASARAALLAATFVVWAFLAHVLAAGRRSAAARAGLVALSLLLFALGLLSKEIAIVFPALLLVAAWLEGRGYLAALPAVAVALLYLFVRREVLGTAVVDFAARAQAVAAADPGSGGARTILDNLWTQARVVPAYLCLLLWPEGLCIHRHVRESHSPLEPQVLLGLAVLVTLLVIALRQRRRGPVVALGLLWFLVALGPESSLIPLNQVMNEHRLYLPAVGIAFVVAVLLPQRAPRMVSIPVSSAAPALEFARAPLAFPAMPMAVATIAVSLALTWQRNEDWRDPVRLWASAVKVSPESDGAWNALGVQLRARRDYPGATDAFLRARDLAPTEWAPPFNLGTIHLERGRTNKDYGDLKEAERWLGESLRVRPGSERSRWYLAETYHAMGRIEKAEDEFRSLAGLSPRLFEMTRFALAKIA
ncbi:MAG TPA: tetratricopeptide repeat protein, partial [Planctomycetota bacterium]|nr:tetratricopeptide repeat protein [Planctomycetota bacterium]